VCVCVGGGGATRLAGQPGPSTRICRTRHAVCAGVLQTLIRLLAAGWRGLPLTPAARQAAVCRRAPPGQGHAPPAHQRVMKPRVTTAGAFFSPTTLATALQGQGPSSAGGGRRAGRELHWPSMLTTLPCRPHRPGPDLGPQACCLDRKSYGSNGRQALRALVSTLGLAHLSSGSTWASSAAACVRMGFSIRAGAEARPGRGGRATQGLAARRGSASAGLSFAGLAHATRLACRSAMLTVWWQLGEGVGRAARSKRDAPRSENARQCSDQ